ncbi:hypothetical protein O0L34_g14096 [Tuta absoluta]|nr:hypothetical protein O0L34_g14096 [Tuta absoluta]
MKASDVSLRRTKTLTNTTLDYGAVVKNSNTFALTIGVCMGFVYCFCGIILLFANMFDSECFVQIFVWLILVNIIVGVIGVIYTAIKCSYGPCILSNMDWLSGAAVLVLILAYCALWFYFVSVANSYVIEKTDY